MGPWWFATHALVTVRSWRAPCQLVRTCVPCLIESARAGAVRIPTSGPPKGMAQHQDRPRALLSL